MDTVMEVMVDWAATDWRATPSFAGIDDITDDFISMSSSRGKDKEIGNNPSGTVDIEVRNLLGKYHPLNTASPLYGYIRPWLPIRIRTIADGSTTTQYTGFVSKIKIPDQRDNRRAHLYCTDGTDLMARNMVTQVNDDRTAMTAGAAIGKVLDAAGWPVSKRSIDTDGGSIVKYPLTVEF